VIPLTSNTPNRHTRAKIRIADACHDHARPIATRITLNTGSAKTSHTFSHNWLDNGGAEGDLMELNGWSSPQMLARYGRSARSARARRHYDDVMGD
jgi:hypothetical protein